MKVGVVLLAGGNGDRFGADVPKQFVNLNGKPIWLHAYEAFCFYPSIGPIVVVLPLNTIEDPAFPIDGLHVATAGPTRRDSSYNGLVALREVCPDCTHVLIHDAARPLVSFAIIARCIEALKTHDACDVTIPSADTIVRIGENEVREIYRRDKTHLGQTPQGFRLSEILRAHASKSSRTFTDDIGLYEAYSPFSRIAQVDGEERNLKITTQADLIKAERLARTLPDGPSFLYPGNALVVGSNGGIGSQALSLLRKQENVTTVGWGRDTLALEGNHEAVYTLAPSSLRYLVIATGSLREAHPSPKVIGPGVQSGFDRWDDEFDINFTHIVRLLGLIHSRQIMQKGGSIVVLGSSSAYCGRPTYTAYSAAKAALCNFIQGYAQEWPEVRLQIVNPGRTNTPMRQEMFPGEDTATLLSPETVAQAILRALSVPETGCVFDVRQSGIDV